MNRGSVCGQSVWSGVCVWTFGVVWTVVGGDSVWIVGGGDSWWEAVYGQLVGVSGWTVGRMHFFDNWVVWGSLC